MYPSSRCRLVLVTSAHRNGVLDGPYPAHRRSGPRVIPTSSYRIFDVIWRFSLAPRGVLRKRLHRRFRAKPNATTSSARTATPEPTAPRRPTPGARLRVAAANRAGCPRRHGGLAVHGSWSPNRRSAGPAATGPAVCVLTAPGLGAPGPSDLHFDLERFAGDHFSDRGETDLFCFFGSWVRERSGQLRQRIFFSADKCFRDLYSG
jgi:hypothetical protein